MPGYDATAIDPVTTPATVRSSACLPEQTSPAMLHASKGRDQSPGACTSPPRYTIPPPSHRRFHCPGPPSYYDRWRWRAAFARSGCCQSLDTLVPGNAPTLPSCSRHNPPPDLAPTWATPSPSALAAISSTRPARDRLAVAATACVALHAADVAE